MTDLLIPAGVALVLASLAYARRAAREAARKREGRRPDTSTWFIGS